MFWLGVFFLFLVVMAQGVIAWFLYQMAHQLASIIKSLGEHTESLASHTESLASHTVSFVDQNTSLTHHTAVLANQTEDLKFLVDQQKSIIEKDQAMREAHLSAMKEGIVQELKSILEDHNGGGGNSL